MVAFIAAMTARRARTSSMCLALLVLVFAARPVLAQAPLPAPPVAPPAAATAPPPPSFPPAEMDRIVSPVALYPDPLLAQTLAAATFPRDISEAERWADDHHYMSGAQLTDAIAADRLPWDPSIQALLPFPSVLDMMASDMPWTEELGNAFLADRTGVMDAVQRMRQRAWSSGYLRSSATVIVHDAPYVEILPVDPSLIVVPYYDPAIVFAPGRVFMRGGGIVWGPGIRLGVSFGPWGWGTTRFAWATHAVIINNAPWGRTWANRTVYVHPYAVPRYVGPRPIERHAAIPRTPRERARARDERDSHRHG